MSQFEVRVAKAVEALDLRLNTPIHIKARVEILNLAKPIEAEYEASWISEEQWEEKVTAPGYSELSVANGKTLVRERSMHYQPFAFLATKNAMRMASSYYGHREREIVQIRKKKVNKRDLECGEFKEKNQPPIFICIDAVSGEIAEIGDNEVFAPLDFTDIGGMRFPKTIEVRDCDSKPIARIRVVTLDRTVVPLHRGPVKGEVVPNCSVRDFRRPTLLPGFVVPQYPELAERARIRGTTRLLVLVQPNGSVVVQGIVKTAGEILDRTAIGAVRQWKFQPAECAGTPMPFEVPVAVQYSTGR